VTNLRERVEAAGSMSELDERLMNLLTALSAKILKCEESAISWSDDIDEFGFESIEVNQLCADLNAILDISIDPSIFLEVTSLQALSEHLKTNSYEKLETKLL
jgi:hypothetical protein